MATFKKNYTVSELLKMVDRSVILPFCFRFDENSIPHFYFVDARRRPVGIESGKFEFVTHRSNFYRFKKKLSNLPFRFCEIGHCNYNQICFCVVPIDSFGYPFYYDPIHQLHHFMACDGSNYEVKVHIL